MPAGKRLVGMSVREPGRAAERLDVDGYHRLLAQIGDFLVHRIDAYVLFVPMERDDIRHSHGVLSHMTAADRGRILHGDYSPRQVLGLMQPLRPGGRHAPALPDLRGDGRHAVPAPAVRRQGLRPGPAARGAGAQRRGTGGGGAAAGRGRPALGRAGARAEATARRVAEVCDQARGTSQVTRAVLDSLRSRSLARIAA